SNLATVVWTTPTSFITSYNNAPSSSSYTQEIFSYTASSTGSAVVQFCIQNSGSGKYWYLDDISIVDTNASNSEMLVNNNFENGTLAGWQMLCSSCGLGTSGTISPSSCNSGSYCYVDECKNGFDCLRQTFPITTGHVYILSYFIKSVQLGNMKAYVQIF
ncbi:unnamed protein product, partial [Adineta ricciae]